MTSKPSKSLSPLATAALALDEDFQRLNQLAYEIGNQSLLSDAKLERAAKLMNQFEACSQQLGVNLSNLAQALSDAREGAERAAASVSDQAVAIQTRREEINRMAERFNKLGAMVRETTQKIAEFNTAKQANSEDIETHSLTDLDMQLGTLVEEARQLMVDAREAHMKGMEGNADSLRQSLQSARHRLSQFTGHQSAGEATVH